LLSGWIVDLRGVCSHCLSRRGIEGLQVVMVKTEKLSKIQIKKFRQTKWQRIKEQESLPKHMPLKAQLLVIIAQVDPSLRRIIDIGMNSVMKSIEGGSCEIVCLCRDAPKNLLDGLVEACLFHKVPVACLPSISTKEVASAFSLKRVNCFAVPKAKSLEGRSLDEHQLGLLDGIREILFDFTNYREVKVKRTSPTEKESEEESTEEVMQ
jgi:ribosomal protein L7Ae-like RNA K-turn-binding protein